MTNDDLRGMPFETLIGYDNGEAPLPNVAGFAHIGETHTQDQADWLSKWIEPQATCSWIMKYHGAAGLRQVLHGIARGCAALGAPMQPRTRSAAEYLGLV